MRRDKVARGMNHYRKELLKLLAKRVPRHLKNNYRKFHHKPMRRHSRFNKVFLEYEDS